MTLFLRVVLLLILSPLSCTVLAVTLEELQLRFKDQPVVRAQFSQLRQIKGLAQPLRSRGELIIARTHGLWWQQQQPFILTLLLDDRRMVQRIAGQSPQTITAESSPQLFQFNHLLRALLQADTVLLAKHFSLDFRDAGAQRWQLILTPRSAPLNKLFSSIRLQGQTYIDTIILDDSQGDRTEIVFHHQHHQPGILSDDEQKRFVF